MSRMGPLLQGAVRRLEEAGSPAEIEAVAARCGSTQYDDRLPLEVKLHTCEARVGQTWQEYQCQVRKVFQPLQARLKETMGIGSRLLIAANSLELSASLPQVRRLAEDPEFELVELDPLVQVVCMDDAVEDIELPAFRQTHASIDGSGVTAAVLDTGVDDAHPFLVVEDSVATTDEDVTVPGSHGTHCAGARHQGMQRSLALRLA